MLAAEALLCRSGYVRNQVRLELVEIDVEGTVEPERRSYGRHDLSDETVQVGKPW